MVDSTPVGCGCSRETAKRSDLAGWAEYGYCASHSRYFWGLRLHVVCTLGGLPVLFALTGANADERETLRDMLDTAPRSWPPIHGRRSSATRITTAASSSTTSPNVSWSYRVRPAGEPERAGAHLFKPLRQTIESINQTFKGQLDLERHGGKSPAGVMVRVLARILALTAAIWWKDKTGQPVKRSLIAYDHRLPRHPSDSFI